MKKIFKISIFAIVLVLFSNCTNEDEETTETSEVTTEETTEATILGRWILEGFETTIRYEFTENKLFTIYGDGSGVFPTLEEFMQVNPQLTGNDWVYEDNIVVVDLNFGNYSRLIPNFKCDNAVIDWTQEDGSEHSTYYREDHDISACN